MSKPKYSFGGTYNNVIFNIESVTKNSVQSGGHAASAQLRFAFVCSTSEDLPEFRPNISKLLDQVAICTRPADGVSFMGFAQPAQAWQQWLQESDYFIGVFGYWYGLVVAGEDYSLQHLAFKWAMQRWQEAALPPMAIYLPEEGSEAAITLLQRTKKLLPPDSYACQQHEARHLALREEIFKTGRTPVYFHQWDQLLLEIFVTIMTWRGNHPLSAATGQIMIVEDSKLPNHERQATLGKLGRDAHIKFLRQAMQRAEAKPDVPAVALVVSGNKEAGQAEFIQALLQLPQIRRGRRAQPGRPPTWPYDTSALIQWVAGAVGLPDPQSIVDVTQLANQIHACLNSQQLCFVLDRVDRLSGGVPAFYNQFWQPLYDQLKNLRTGQTRQYRLLAVIVNYAGPLGAQALELCEDTIGSSMDFSHPVLLPELTDISEDDVLAWLNDLEVDDDPPGRHDEIVRAILTDTFDQPDGTPSRVFYRLRNELVWPEGADNE